MNSQPDPDHNLDQAYRRINTAVNRGALFVGLPENFAFLGDLHQRIDRSDEIMEKSLRFLQQTAEEFGIYLLGGSFPAPAGDDKVYNRTVLVNPDGRIAAQYDKIHLFDVYLSENESYNESDFVKEGDTEAVVYESDRIGNIGLSICYDLRFPELYRKLSEAGAEILCVPSAFTATTGRDHWKPLLQARAIENTGFIIAPAQTGIHGEKRSTHGHSMIIDPWGTIISDAQKDGEMAIGEINFKHLEETRMRIPSLKHRTL